MIRFFNQFLINSQSIVRTNRFLIGNNSDNDFNNINKKSAGQTVEINETNAQKVIDEVIYSLMQWVNSNDVCLFMKGSPKQPQCGYSKFVATTLSMQGINLD
jgi:hypothetical protein